MIHHSFWRICRNVTSLDFSFQYFFFIFLLVSFFALHCVRNTFFLLAIHGSVAVAVDGAHYTMWLRVFVRFNWNNTFHLNWSAAISQPLSIRDSVHIDVLLRTNVLVYFWNIHIFILNVSLCVCTFFALAWLGVCVCVCVRRFKLKNLTMHPLESVETRAKAPLSNIPKSFFDAAEFQPNSIRIEIFFLVDSHLGKWHWVFMLGPLIA